MDIPEYFWQRPLPDGRLLCIMPLLYGQARLGVGPPHDVAFEDVW